MSWEQRGKKKYYYRKKRVGNRVYSIYLGNEKQAKVIAEKYEARKKAREEVRQWLYAIDDEEKKVDKMVEDAELVVNALAILAGYHCHKGQWRKAHERDR